MINVHIVRCFINTILRDVERMIVDIKAKGIIHSV